MEQEKRVVVCPKGHRFRSNKVTPVCNACAQLEAFQRQKNRGKAVA